MKKSELRRIIREEISKMDEAYQKPKLQVAKVTNRGHKYAIIYGSKIIAKFKPPELAKAALEKNGSFYEYWAGSVSVSIDNSPKNYHIIEHRNIARGSMLSESYYSSASAAVAVARAEAEKRGYDIDEDDWFNQINSGGSYGRLRPNTDETRSFSIGLYRKGRLQKKTLNISLYGMPGGKVELTNYIL